MQEAHRHTHTVQTGRCEGQCCLTEIYGKENVLSLLLKEEGVAWCLGGDRSRCDSTHNHAKSYTVTVGAAHFSIAEEFSKTEMSGTNSDSDSVMNPVRFFVSSSPSMTFPHPSGQKPSLDSFKSNLKTCLFPKQQTCHVFHSILIILYGQYYSCVDVCVCMRLE